MTILDKINNHKRKEVEAAKATTPISELEKSPFFERETISARESILDPKKSGIISEFKRQSPSKGLINGVVKPAEVGAGYEAAGASCISVLTDKEFFGGTKEDLIAVREVVNIPVLRKDFIIDEYQILEAKAWGADFILLIAASLTFAEVEKLAHFAKSLGLEVLMEVNNAKELDLCCEYLDIVGVNNRNLKTFEVNIANSIELFNYIPSDFVRISESGINKAENLIKLKQYGFEGFLMGEAFMKTDNPAEALKEYIALTGLVQK